MKKTKTMSIRIDGKVHDVTVRFIVSEQLVLSAHGEGRTLVDKVDVGGITAIKMGTGKQNVIRVCM